MAAGTYLQLLQTISEHSFICRPKRLVTLLNVLAPNGARPVGGPGRMPGPAGLGTACGPLPAATPRLALHCEFSAVDRRYINNFIYLSIY